MCLFVTYLDIDGLRFYSKLTETGEETSKGKGRELSWFPPGSLAACEEQTTGTRVEAGRPHKKLVSLSGRS